MESDLLLAVVAAFFYCFNSLGVLVRSEQRAHYVRIRQNTRKYRNFNSKKVYARHILQLTIPNRFKNVVEPFLNKDLKVETKREGDSLVITAKIANAYKTTDG